MADRSKPVEAVLADAKALSDLLGRLQDELKRASDKNDSLLEAIESSEARAGSDSAGEAPLLRNLRARLAAAHAPSAALRRDLSTFSGLFEKRVKELSEGVREYESLRQHVLVDERDLQDRLRRVGEEREALEEERQQWREELTRTQQDIIEQNDRLTVLSEQLSGAKDALDAKSHDLASQRLAFEEEKLTKGEERVGEGEAEELRLKLKEQVLRNVELESALLKTELSLHQREESMAALRGRNERLQQDVLLARQASTRAIKQFEKRTTEANKKLAHMNSELAKAQEHARRFQELLSTERRKQKGLKHALEQEFHRRSASAGGELLPVAAQRAFIDTLSEALGAPSKPHGPVRIGDVVKKNEAILVENANMKAELRQLRIENADLLRRVRFTDNNAHHMRNHVVTSIADRAELMRRLEKAELQYRELEQSLAQQASDWVARRQRDSRLEKTVRQSQIQPIPVLGASERTWSSPGRTQTQTRSIPVHKW